MPLFRSPLANALGTAPDADASIYIASAGVTKLEQQIGINKLVAYLKAESLWTTLAGGFLFGNDVQKSTGTTLIDLKAGASATLTGGAHGQSGILLTGANADQISFGARTFTLNYMPSVYLLFSPYIKTTTASSHRINFGPLSTASTYRGFCPHSHDQTGSSTNMHLQCYRGDGNRYTGTGVIDGSFGMSTFVGASFSSNDQKVLGAANSFSNGATTTAVSITAFASAQTWLLGPFTTTSTTSTEVTTVAACLFWDSNITISQRQTTDIDSLIRDFAL